jgi:hypothetical protein
MRPDSPSGFRLPVPQPDSAEHSEANPLPPEHRFQLAGIEAKFPASKTFCRAIRSRHLFVRDPTKVFKPLWLLALKSIAYSVDLAPERAEPLQEGRLREGDLA